MQLTAAQQASSKPTPSIMPRCISKPTKYPDPQHVAFCRYTNIFKRESSHHRIFPSGPCIDVGSSLKPGMLNPTRLAVALILSRGSSFSPESRPRRYFACFTLRERGIIGEWISHSCTSYSECICDLPGDEGGVGCSRSPQCIHLCRINHFRTIPYRLC